MSIQIYRDVENNDPTTAACVPLGKEGKRAYQSEEQCVQIPKPCKTKRVALSTIAENTSASCRIALEKHSTGCLASEKAPAIGCRVQPSRLVKGKTKTSNDANAGFSIFEDDFALYSNNCLVSKEGSIATVSPLLSTNISPVKLQSSTAQYNNIQLHSDPILAVPEYAADVHGYLKIIEKKNRPKIDYMRKQGDINASMRAILIDWLVEVAQEYKLKEQTLCLTVNYIDRFLSFMSVQRSKLQLVGAACMLIAAKFEEIYPPEVKEFVYITDDTFSAKQVLRMEHLILKTLAFDVSVPTCRDFISRYLAAAEAPTESHLQHLVEYLCQLTIIDLNCCVKYLPSMIVAASLCVANMALKIPLWSPKLSYHTEYKLEDITDCVKDICAILKAAPTNQQQAIQTKFKNPKFGSVTEIRIPEDLLILNQFGE